MERIINITPNASKKHLKELLQYEASRAGANLRNFCGDILEKSILNKHEYDKKLSVPMSNNGGYHISCVVSSEAKKAIKEWAVKKKRTQGKHCAFILEKWCEINKVTIDKLSGKTTS